MAVKVSSDLPNEAAVSWLAPLAPPPALPRLEDIPVPRLGSLSVIEDLPPLGTVPLEGLEYSSGENTCARAVDGDLLSQTRGDDPTETAPTRKRSSVHPGPMAEILPVDGTEPTARAVPMVETLVRSDLGELGVLRRRKSDRVADEARVYEEPSGERERPSPILYAAPVPSFDDVSVQADWERDRPGPELPSFASADPTESTVTELPTSLPSAVLSSPWPSQRVAPSPPPPAVAPSDDMSTAAERAPVPPGRYVPPSWSLPASRRPGGVFGEASRFPKAPTGQVPVSHASAPPPGFSQAAIAYASSPMFQPQVPTISTPAAPRPMRGMWFVAGAAFGLAFALFATGLIGRSSEEEAPEATAAPTAPARPRAPAPGARQPAPNRAYGQAPQAPARQGYAQEAPRPAPPTGPSTTVLAASGTSPGRPVAAPVVAPAAAPTPAPAPRPKVEAQAAPARSSGSRRTQKSTHASSHSGTGGSGSPLEAALAQEPASSKASGSRSGGSKRSAVDDDPDGIMGGADPSDLLGAALKP